MSEVLEKRAVVHPEFVPELSLWVEPKSHIAAKSLRELKKHLPPGTKIKDYHPNGYGLFVRPKVTYKMPIEELARTPTIKEIRKVVPEPMWDEVPRQGNRVASSEQNSDGGISKSLSSGEIESSVTTIYPPSEPEPKPVEIQQEVKFVQPKRREPKKAFKYKIKPGKVDWETYEPLMFKLAAEGLSMGKIAEQIPNATRSSVAGRGRRKGISFSHKPGPDKGYGLKEKDVVEET